MLECPLQSSNIEGPRSLETMIKALVDANKPVSSAPLAWCKILRFMLAFEQKIHHRRYDRSRQNIGSQHGKYHCHCQGREEVVGNSSQHKDGNKNDADRKSRHEH